MTQAVRCYQAEYQPRQLASGLRTSEARMLMVMEKDASLSTVALQQLVAMPLREIEEARANLERKGLVQRSEDDCSLTAAGQDQAETLWSIAEQQQAQIFARYTPEQLEGFKSVLCGLIASG